MAKARGTQRAAAARDSSSADWQSDFALLWLELLEKHGKAVALAAQLTAPSGGAFGAAQRQRERATQLQKEIGVLGELLTNAEEIIRKRLMNDDGDGDGGGGEAGAVTPPPKTSLANNRSGHHKQQSAGANSLDAYLARTPPPENDNDDDDDDVVFVNAVRGWDAPPPPRQRVAVLGGRGGRGGSSAADVRVFDGLELHDIMMQNNARNVGASAPSHSSVGLRRNGAPTAAAPVVPRSRSPAHQTQTQSILTSAQPLPSTSQTTTAEKSGKKRKLSSTSATASSPLQKPHEQPSRRGVRKTIQALHAERVLKYREGNHLCEYLVKWTGRAEPLWVFRKQCGEQAKQVIDAFNRQRKSGAGKAHSLKQPSAAPLDTDSSTDDGDIFIVDKIVDHRVRYGKKQYLVKWDGYDSSDNTWESATKLQADVADVVDAYERKVAREQQLQQSTSSPSGEQCEKQGSSDGADLLETSTQRHEGERATKLRAQAIDDSDGEAGSRRRSEDDENAMESRGRRSANGSLEKGAVVVVDGSDTEEHDLA